MFVIERWQEQHKYIGVTKVSAGGRGAFVMAFFHVVPGQGGPGPGLCPRPQAHGPKPPAPGWARGHEPLAGPPAPP